MSVEAPCSQCAGKRPCGEKLPPDSIQNTGAIPKIPGERVLQFQDIPVVPTLEGELAQVTGSIERTIRLFHGTAKVPLSLLLLKHLMDLVEAINKAKLESVTI